MLQLHECTLGETLYESSDTIVRRAKHNPSGERLVVKMSVAGSTRSAGRLAHEQRMLLKLADMPGVVRMRGFEHDAGRATLWLEDQGAHSLDRVLATRSHLPVGVVLRLGLQLARTLERIHAAGVVHKDIKPQNILWDENTETVTLLDFAIASELAEEATNAAIPEALEGTLAYISPEQTGRTARGVDARTDLYSLGVTLFEMLAGRRPFIETDALALVHAHLAKPVPALETLVPGLSAVVARIIERCLEKHPEKRYQTAKALVADLAECVKRLEEHGFIDSFVLGRKDFSPALRISQTLVARDQEAAEITAAFSRASKGAVEVLLLGGPSGVGKTALVRSVYQEIAKTGRGLLLSGKHDQLGRSVPYAALAQAFGGLMRDVAASPKHVFDSWKERVEQKLGMRARVIADLVPELEWLMGPLAPVPVVPTDMTYNRLKLSWIEFVRAVADASPPLVLFLDDMQWVDPASVELLKTLLTDVGKKNLLVIAAYRDNEVDAGHFLWNIIETIDNANVNTSRLVVGPLDHQAVTQWLGTTLSTDTSRVQPLAKALQGKTHGNPFFLGQLLLELHRQKRVRRNLDTGAWEWDQDAVESATITDNVVELMRQKVVELPLDTQTLLGQAACAGHGFSLTELAVIAGVEQTQAAQNLQSALLAGLLIPENGHYREARALAHVGATADATYRFLHDRVQQAFYERIDPRTRAQTHLLIGRRLQNVFDREGGSNQKQLEFVRHLNLGAAALSTDDERKGLARVNLRAANAAKVNGSYELQASLVGQAQALLGERAWRDEPELSVQLALERIESDFMLRAFDEVHRGAERLLNLPLPPVPRLVAQELRARAYYLAGRYEEGSLFAREALAEHGITYPDSNEARIAQAVQWMHACNAWLDQHPEGFTLLPFEASPKQTLLDAVEGMVALCSVRIAAHRTLGILATARNVNEVTQRQSLTLLSPYSFCGLAHMLSSIFGNYRSNVRWADEGYRAARRLASPFFSNCEVIYGVFAVFTTPVKEILHYQSAAIRDAMASGSFSGASQGMVNEEIFDLWRGRPLGEMAAQEERMREIMVRAGDAAGRNFFVEFALYTTLLRTPSNLAQWASRGYEAWSTHEDEIHLAHQRLHQTHLLLALGEHKAALELANEAERFRATILASPFVADIYLCRGLAAAKCWSAILPESERAGLIEKLDQGIQRFQYFSEGCAENFLHQLRLLEAEQARIQDKPLEAMAKYDEAIDLARKEGFLHIEALAAHFCATFFLELGRKRHAAMYLEEARDAYTRWDALALVAHIENKYPDLLKTQAPVYRASTISMTTTATQETSGRAALDFHTAVRAAQALSGELDPARVVGRLMELCLANAGAERGALVFVENESLVLVARLSVHGSQIETGLSIPLTECQDVATTVIRYVARSREPVVVNQVAGEKRFTDDPYLVSTTVRSLLALPLSHRGRLGGILYLEHQSAPSAFPPARVEFLSVLASQAAIAVENANLYRSIEAQVQALEVRHREVQQLNDELRRQIAQRSRRLMDSLLPTEDANVSGGSFEEGDSIGDCYRVLRKIGEGGMGAVYEVERTTDGVHLAAKVLNHSPDRSDLGRFVREAQILAKLSHPNLISIHDIDVTDQGILYIVMDFVAGTTLRHYFEERKGDVSWTLDMLAQVAQALDALHTQSIVHRDLKPDNILVVSSGRNAPPLVKLADFGISIVTSDRHANKLLDALAVTQSIKASPTREANARGPMLTETGIIVGTPMYMAPELGDGSKNAQASSDIFSFGVIAFELITGTRPYSFPPVLGGLVNANVVEVLAACPSLNANMANRLARCLDIAPEKRPSAREIVETIRPQ